MPTAIVAEEGMALAAGRGLSAPTAPNQPFLRYTKTDSTVPALKYAHFADSGLDLYSPVDLLVWPFQTVTVNVGVRLNIPDCHEAQIRPRSSMSKAGWVQNVGTVDNGYKGELGVVLNNPSFWFKRIKKGQKIAQLVVAPVAYCRPVEVSTASDGSLGEQEIEQPKSDRGDGGFGSTGK